MRPITLSIEEFQQHAENFIKQFPEQVMHEVPALAKEKEESTSYLSSQIQAICAPVNKALSNDQIIDKAINEITEEILRRVRDSKKRGLKKVKHFIVLKKEESVHAKDILNSLTGDVVSGYLCRPLDREDEESRSAMCLTINLA